MVKIFLPFQIDLVIDCSFFYKHFSLYLMPKYTSISSFLYISTFQFCQQLLIICSLNAEILRVSGMMSNQGFCDLDRLRHRSPSPMASSNLMTNVSSTGLSGWNGLPQEVFTVFA